MTAARLRLSFLEDLSYLMSAARMYFSESNSIAFNLSGSVVFSESNSTAVRGPAYSVFGDSDSSALKLAGQSHVRRVELGCT